MSEGDPQAAPINVSRRTLLAGLGALVLGVALPRLALAEAVGGPGAASGAGPSPLPETDLNAFVGISTDGWLTVLIPSSEMGQGISTGLAQCVAEELDMPWSQVRVAHADEGKAFRFSMIPGDPRHMTGGSLSTRVWRTPYREAGAAARVMLVSAAARRWGVDPESCATEGGEVRHPSGQSAPYGALVVDAAKLRPPRRVTLKAPEEFKLIGTSPPREDLRGKVTGQATFGVDVRLPGMLRACTLESPVVGGVVRAVDDAAARAIPGVVDVLTFDTFVAVVAKTWWPARKGIAALKVTWDEGPNAALDDAEVSRVLDEALDSEEGVRARKVGKALKILEESGADLDAIYAVPYVDHAPMEPLNCTVHVQPDRCDVWVGTQGQSRVLWAAQEVTGLKEDQIHVHTVYLGGGFGRRGCNDFAEMALKIGAQVKAPVQMLWTREEMTRHGYYRPAMKARMRASIKGKSLEALHIRVVGDNASRLYLPPWLLKIDRLSALIAEGMSAKESPYDYPNVLVEALSPALGLRVGYWRSVGHSYTSFFRECFLDEVAHALGQDPLALRLSLLKAGHPRLRAVLEKAASEAGWGDAPEGRYQGIALQESFGSLCAEVVEISMEGAMPRVQRITAAIDCGAVTNPDQVRAQVMGGALYGLSSAMGEKISLKGGRVVESNFHDYRLLRMNQSPITVDVHIIDQPNAPPGGVGEPGTPPAVPALCNAIFAATGKRIRRLPVLDALAEEA